MVNKNITKSKNTSKQTPKKQNKQKKRTPKSQRVKKIIQGGGYYQQNDFHHHHQQQDTGNNEVSVNGNLLVVLIGILLLVIGGLVYLNMNSKPKTNLDEEINTELLKEAQILKKHKQNNTSNQDKFKNTEEEYHSILNAHPQYSAGHRIVAADSDNPQIIPMMPTVLNHNVERIINPLLPPERSYVNTYGIPTNIPSRGFSGGYQQVGSLHKTAVSDDNTEPGNNNKSVILPLFGQPTYPGSNKWNYYTTTDKHAMVKMTFKVGGKDSDDRHGVNEIMTGDQIQIPEYNGDFDVKVYQFDQPRYIPFVY